LSAASDAWLIRHQRTGGQERHVKVDNAAIVEARTTLAICDAWLRG
jgi:hypothetical protein